MNTGWICPKCATVFAPSIPECNRCSPAQSIPQDDSALPTCRTCGTSPPQGLCNAFNDYAKTECDHKWDYTCMLDSFPTKVYCTKCKKWKTIDLTFPPRFEG